MPHLNVEIKAQCADQNAIREILRAEQAEFKGVDRQIDTYFNIRSGRLKLREGNIENYLIHYERENIEGPKQSHVTLFAADPASTLKEILLKSLGALVTVDKQREIYYIANVKFHLDSVEDLGTFVEIEAIDMDGTIGKEQLLAQCAYYLELFAIPTTNLLADSYSDLLLRARG